MKFSMENDITFLGYPNLKKMRNKLLKEFCKRIKVIELLLVEVDFMVLSLKGFRKFGKPVQLRVLKIFCNE